MYEVFEHTADLGLHVEAPTLEGLFAEAGRALFSVIVEELDAVEPRTTREVRLEGPSEDYLLFDWLTELLYLFEREHLLFARFEVRRDGDRLVGRASGEGVDPARHHLTHEVKAITYHGLFVEGGPAGFAAEVILDI